MSRYHTTRWSLIRRAAADDPPARRALGELLQHYRPPIEAFFRRACGHDDVDELTQAFYLHFIEQAMHRRASAERGRFRGLLAASLRHFLSDQRARQQAARRGGGQAAASQAALAELAADDSPERAFEASFARTVLQRAMLRLERETAELGRAELYAALRPFLLDAAEAGDYAPIAARFGLRENAVALAVRRLRVRLQAWVRSELADTLEDPQQLDAELAALRQRLREA